MLLFSFNSRWALVFLTPSLHTWTVSLHSFWVTCPFLQLLCASFSCFSRELLVHPHRPVTFAWFPAHCDGPFLSLEEVILEYQTGLLDPVCSPGLSPIGFFQAGLCTGQSLLSWNLELLSCYLPFSILSVYSTPPSHGQCSSDSTQALYHQQFVRLVRKVSLFVRIVSSSVSFSALFCQLQALSFP